MNEFKITYTRHLICQWLKETLTVTQWDITIESDNSIFFVKAGSNSTTVPIEGLKKVELKSKYNLFTFICGALLALFGLSGITSLDTIVIALFVVFLGVLLFMQGFQNELTFYMKENAVAASAYRIAVPFFEKEKLQQAQKAIRAVMAYETEKRDATKHTEMMADAVHRVADAIGGNPQPRAAIPSQRPSIQKAIASPQSTKMTPQQQASVLEAKKRALAAANAAQLQRAKNSASNKNIK